MADAKELQDWFEQWNSAPGRDAWNVLEKVAKLEETKLRNILRPHEEASIGGGRFAPMVQLGDVSLPLSDVRASLDDALDALTFLEIGYQLGGYGGVQVPNAAKRKFLLPAVEQSLAKLIHSEAFIRYVDVYLFFGIRFLAARVPALRKEIPPSPEDQSGSCQMNRASLLLMRPPRVKMKPDDVMPILKEMTAPRTKDEEVALNFLDGFRQKRGSENEEAEPRRASTGAASRTGAGDARALAAWLVAGDSRLGR